MCWRLAIGVLLVIGPAGMWAQESEVPVDREGRVVYVTRDLENKLNLFPDIRGFLEARLFETPSGQFVLEISQRVDGRLVRQRRMLTAQQVEEFRAQVSSAFQTRAPSGLLDQDGRGNLIRGSLLLSLGYYGWAVPVALDIDDSQTAVALYMLTSSGAFFAPLFLTRSITMTKGMADLALYGATRGIGHGVLVSEIFNQQSERARLGYGVVGGLAEAIAGGLVARRGGMSQGTANLTGMGGDFGAGIGLGLAYVSGLMDATPSGRRSIGWAGGLVGAGAGLAGGYVLAGHETYTIGDVSVFRAAGLLGGYVGLTVAVVARTGEVDPGKRAVAATMAGALAGLVTGQRLVHGRDFSGGQGMLTSLGALGGGLLGLGIGYLIDDQDEKSLMAASAIGAAAGFAALYASSAGEARREVDLGALDVRVDPFALVLRSPEPAAARPLVRVSYRF